MNHGIHLPFVAGNCAEEWWVKEIIAEFVTGGTVANLEQKESHYKEIFINKNNSSKLTQTI